eukprot:1869552-Pyramimonas_sp.AAC.2
MRNDEGRRLALNDIKNVQRKTHYVVGLYALHGRFPLAMCKRSTCFFCCTGNHKAMRRLRGIRTDFRYLFWNFREIARAVHETGGIVCIEWPTQ